MLQGTAIHTEARKDPLPRSNAEPLAFIFVSNELLQPVRHEKRLSWGHNEASCSIAKYLPAISDIRSNNGQSSCHGFNKRVGKALLVRGQDLDVARTQE